MKCGNLNYLESSGPPQACNGTVFTNSVYGALHCVLLLMISIELGTWLDATAEIILSPIRLGRNHVMWFSEMRYTRPVLSINGKTPTGICIMNDQKAQVTLRAATTGSWVCVIHRYC
jgi:hypothetical protein